MLYNFVYQPKQLYLIHFLWKSKEIVLNTALK